VSGQILATRDQLLAALTTAGIETAYAAGERVPVPGVIMEPGDPWIDHAGVLRGATQRISWNVAPVAGKSDAAGILDELAELIEATWAALASLVGGAGGWTTPTVSAPRLRTVNGADHITADLPMTTHIDMAAA
jgi:hypothetical protein